jgi:hypothetical protein
MTMRRRQPAMRARPSAGHRPAHPTAKAIALMVGVVLLIVALALVSTFG